MSSSRSMSSAAKKAVQWIGSFTPDRLPTEWRQAAEKYTQNGAKKKVGEIKTAQILTRERESPIHQSSFNRKDKAEIISVKITPRVGPASTHHIYKDGTGTARMGDKKEYSTYSRR